MRSVWCLLWARTRRLPSGLVAIALLGLALPSGALAQSSVGQALNAATGRSLADSVEQNLKDIMGSGGAAFGMAASPTGRLRHSEHNGLIKKGFSPDPDNPNFAWRTDEASVFANGVYAVPGTVLGGQLKLAGFAGYNWLSLDLKPNKNFQFDPPEQSGSGDNGSVIAGATALWSQKNTYMLAAIVGFWGQTRLNDSIDDCFNAGNPPPSPPNNGNCERHRYKFNTAGFTGTLTTGHVFDLSKSPSGPKLDIRGSGSFIQNISDPFLNSHLDVANTSIQEQTYKFSTWTATGSATIFANIALQNSALLRPYIQGYVRQEIGYNNKLVVVDQDPLVPTVIVHYNQVHTYGGVDVGATYALGNMTLGAAAYYDGSADERTFGGRLGASWKLN